jgi:Tol biopolymer transport system component
VHAFQYDVISRGRIGAGIQTLISVNPPLWFAEGMAEYLSIGKIDAHTAMWLRDAALEGGLPTIEQMTVDPQRFFPYRFGQALWSYVGEKWGDEVIGEILQSSMNTGVEGAFRRALGMNLELLSNEWIDAIQTTYLPRLANHYRARRVAEAALTQQRPGGSVHLAPALSPDGRSIAFLSELNTFSLNLYIADVESGRIKRELAKSGFTTDFESLRFITSAGTWSPNGEQFAIAAKSKNRDDLVLFDTRGRRDPKRIHIPLNGLTTPAWTPDGKQLVFTGSDGGITDLFMINADGSDMRRLTNDRYADYQPTISPDGKKIAFATDRGPITDFDKLRWGNWRIAIYDIATGAIEVLPLMERGKNINPQWSPDGNSIAFVSDRTGISNIFLYDLVDKNVYQLTNVYTGISGITSLSPVLSWASKSDRLAFAYYESGSFNVYTIDNPRSLRRQPYQEPAQPPMVGSLLAAVRADTLSTGGRARGTGATPAESGSVVSVYRGMQDVNRPSDSTPPTDTSSKPINVSELLSTDTLGLPDTTQFTFKNYRTRFSPDFVARPSIGYQRDNFGRGFFGGSAISLSDILGNKTMVFSAAVNGRLAEAQILGVYINQSHRLNWAVGARQNPLYFWAPSSLTRIDNFMTPTNTTDSLLQQTFRIRRFVIRDAFVESYYPFNRFRRIELGMRLYNVSDDVLELSNYYDANTRAFRGSDAGTVNGENVSYLEPSVTLVHDRTRFGFVGPFWGARSRFSFAPAFGGWRFITGTADYRRYLFARPFTLAFRGLVVGRFGRDANEFPVFLGSTELLRGYTSGSLRDNECGGTLSGPPSGTFRTGCAELDQLIGSKLAVGNVELRFPLTRALVLGLLPIALPPVEGAIFYDIGMAWEEGSVLKWRRDPGDDLLVVRQPLRSWGASIRTNVLGILILRFDYTNPLDRTRRQSYWTVSIGPTF